MTRYISNHPFVFLINLILIASCCSGAYLFASGLGRAGQARGTATSATATTPQPIRTAGLTPGATPTKDNLAALLPEPSVTVSETPTPEATANRSTDEPTATVTLEPLNSAAPLVVTFIDVGQGDSILIVAPEGQTALIDGGSAGSGALAYLQAQGIKSIDLLVATHPNEDHIGGLIEILNALPVKKVISNGQAETTASYEQFLDAIANAKAEYGEAGRGDSLELGSLAFSVLNPATIIPDQLNTNSLVLRMSYGATRFLFMGDADMNAEAGILSAGLPVQADILKVGHHGSCESSSPAFLEAVQPLVAIYSAGSGNPFGHPCAGTLSALNARGIFVFGTDLGGSITVTVTTDGYTITNATGVIFRR
jgi:competence protein ComEC